MPKYLCCKHNLDNDKFLRTIVDELSDRPIRRQFDIYTTYEEWLEAISIFDPHTGFGDELVSIAECYTKEFDMELYCEYNFDTDMWEFAIGVTNVIFDSYELYILDGEPIATDPEAVYQLYLSIFEVFCRTGIIENAITKIYA